MFYNLKRLVSSSRHVFNKKWLCSKEKIKLSFSWAFLKTTYFQKSHTCIGCFGLFTKLGRHMEVVFTAGFLHTFSIKMFLIKYPVKWASLNIWGEWPNWLKNYSFDWKGFDSNPTRHSAGLFLAIIWLVHSQLLVIFKGTTSLT